MAENFDKKTIKINCNELWNNNGEKFIEIEAFCKKGLAYHAVCGGWTVTHIKSGMGAIPYKTIKSLNKVKLLIEDMLNLYQNWEDDREVVLEHFNNNSAERTKLIKIWDSYGL